MLIAGLMSGTSADGIDCAICEVTGFPPDLEWSLHAFQSFAWPDDVRQKILDLYVPGRADSKQLCIVNSAIAELLADAVRKTAGDASLDLVSSHGQTVWHQPDDVQVGGYSITSTLQIGDLSRISERTGTTTIGNFRTKDMAAGGQGAPLVPYTDWLMFADSAESRILLNVGGIANATRLAAGCSAEEVIAFDTGPGNALIDLAVSDITDGRLKYDTDGRMAAKGSADEAVIAELLTHEYFIQKPPKSTGRELFSEDFYKKIRGRFRSSDEDLVATLAAFTAESIASSFRNWILPGMTDSPKVYVGGGGSRNLTLMKMLAERSGLAVSSISELGLDPDAKEAVCFAILGYLGVHGLPGSLPSVTGATKASVLGEIAPGDNYIPLMKSVVGSR